MSSYDASIDRDGNRQIISGPSGLPFKATKRITFIGGTANAIGDHDGTADPTTLFTVTGDVVVEVLGVVKTTLEGAATIEVGVTGATAAILAQVSDATTLAVNEVWGADATVSLAEGFTPTIHGIGGGLDIIMTLASANITAGVIDFYCFYRPLSSDGEVTGD
jgi:hypothetical protein